MIFFRDARALAFAALLPLISSGTLGAAEVIGVACQGRILPASRVIRIAAYSETGAPVVAKLTVEEGAEVKAGDIIAELASLPMAKARVAAADAELKAATLAIESAMHTANLAVTDAELEVSASGAALASAKFGNSRKRLTDPQLREIALALAAKEAEVTRILDSRPAFVARADKGVDAALVAAAAASGDSRKIADAEAERARAGRELAVKDFDARLAGETDAIGLLKARLEQARDLNALPQTQDEEVAAAGHRQAHSGPRLDEVRAKLRTDMERAKADLAAAAARLDLTRMLAETSRIKAPVAGKILRVHARAGEAVGPEGIVELGDLSKIIVVAEVAAADLPRVKSGAKAEITVPGIEKPVTGVVSRISPLIGANVLSEENPAAFKDLRVAPVEITVDEPSAVAGLIRAQVTVRIAP